MKITKQEIELYRKIITKEVRFFEKMYEEHKEADPTTAKFFLEISEYVNMGTTIFLDWIEEVNNENSVTYRIQPKKGE
jgi:hypothetical protein